MEVIRVERRPPPLQRPVLVAAFRGWNDAGDAASGAVETLAATLDTELFADIDPEEFFDFQASRPCVSTVAGAEREINWPENRFSWGHLPGSGRDAILLDGSEPNLRWRTFTAGVLGLALDLGAELIVTLGALQVDVPHTRPVLVTGSTSDLVLQQRLELRPSTYEGPTGITGVLHAAAAARQVPSVSLWAGVPHYLAQSPFLAATLALAERVVTLLGADVSLGALARDAAAQGDDLGALLESDEDLAAYVAELEERRASAPEDGAAAGDLEATSGDEIAAELERYLRGRGDG